MSTDERTYFTLPGKDHVRICKDVVIKFGSVDQLRIEAAKTQKAYLIGQECGLFRAPQVKEFDEIKGRLVLERIPNITGITRTIAFRRGNESLVSRVGQCLATIHQELHIPPEMKIGLTTCVAGPEPHVFLHGDYTLDNICLSPQQSLVILDWQTSLLHGGEATFGTGYFDLAWFLTNLFYLRSRGRRFLICRPVAGLADRFVESYLANMPTARTGRQLGEYLDRFFRAMITVRKNHFAPHRRFRLMFSLPQYKRFIRKCYHLTSESAEASDRRIQHNS